MAVLDNEFLQNCYSGRPQDQVQNHICLFSWGRVLSSKIGSSLTQFLYYP